MQQLEGRDEEMKTMTLNGSDIWFLILAFIPESY